MPHRRRHRRRCHQDRLSRRAAGHAYTVTAQASDGTLTSSQTFTIAVTDVAPSTPVDSDGAANTVAEGAANGTTVGVTASSTDVNGPAVTYSLTGDTSGGGFAIDATTGVVTVADRHQDRLRERARPRLYRHREGQRRHAASSQTFTIAVDDVAPSHPVDSNAAANSVAEGAANGSTVGVTASVDRSRTGRPITYCADRRHLRRRLHHQCRRPAWSRSPIPTKIDFESSARARL